MLAWWSRWASIRPAGPPPTIATCVRMLVSGPLAPRRRRRGAVQQAQTTRWHQLLSISCYRAPGVKMTWSALRPRDTTQAHGIFEAEPKTVLVVDDDPWM